jgi:hypothetical protein
MQNPAHVQGGERQVSAAIVQVLSGQGRIVGELAQNGGKGWPAFLIRDSRVRGAAGKRTATVWQRTVGRHPVQPLRVLEQGNRAAERTALVDHAHRRGEDSFLFVMPETVPAPERSPRSGLACGGEPGGDCTHLVVFRVRTPVT